MVTRVPTRMITTTGVQAGSYTAADITVNEAGQITSAANNSVVVSGGGGGPKISGVAVTDSSWTVLDDTAVDVLGGYIKITGTGFSSGCLVYFNQTPASSVSFVSSTELRVTTGALSAGTYVVYAINTDGGVAISVPGVTFSASPAWQTSSTLSDQYDGVAITLGLVATEATSYTLVSGSLPPGLSLNSSTGAITGTVTGVTVDTSYTFTVRATDAQNQDSPRTFTVTITVSDPHFSKTTLLLSGNAISANTVLRDSSTNNFNLTAVGDTRASNFTPYGTGWSAYFDGTTDFVSTPTGQTNLTLGTSDFTIEGWFYIGTQVQTDPALFTSDPAIGLANTIMVQFGSSTLKAPLFVNNAHLTASSTNNYVVPNQWNHIAVCRTGGSTYSYYINGVAVDNVASNSTSLTTNSWRVGYWTVGANAFTGNISNFRIIKGTALYSGATITVPTEPLTAVANTQLLILQSNNFIDSSTNNFAITRNGDVAIRSFNPFGITNTGVNGSAYFDGTGDYAVIPISTNLRLGNSDWSFECWVYTTNFAASRQALMNGQTDGATAGGSSYFFAIANTTIINDMWIGGVNYGINCPTPSLNSWNHIAYARTGGTMSAYLNGVRVSTRTDLGTLSFQDGSTTYTPVIGGANGGTNLLTTGYISNLRFIKGTGGFDATQTTITIPTSPVSTTSNTQLLTLQYNQPHNNHTFLDASSNQFLLTRYGNTTQGSFSPFSPAGYSYYLDGGDQFSSPSTANLNLNLYNNWTVEGWFYRTGTFGVNDNVLSLGTKRSAVWWSFYVGTSGGGAAVGFGTGSWAWATGPTGPSSGINLNQWHHVAFVRNGASTLLIFIDGILQYTNTSYNFGSATQGGTLYIGSYVNDADNVGAYYSGYISNLRIVNGQSLYTTNFTPSTSVLTTTSQGAIASNVALLTAQSNRFIDVSLSARALTMSGDAKVAAFSPFTPTAVYNPVTHGGSGYLDGSGDYFILTNESAYDFGDGNFSIDFWYYPLSAQGYGGIYTRDGQDYPLSILSGTSITPAWPECSMSVGTTTTWFATGINTSGVQKYAWNHIAFTRVGNTFRAFTNGVLSSVVTASGTMGSGGTPWIGKNGTAAGLSELSMYLSGFRMTKGGIPTLFSTSSTTTGTTIFAVPTQPFTANDSLTGGSLSILANFADAAILDSTGRQVFETVADAKSSGVVTKFTGGSISFDGTGDALRFIQSPYWNITSTTTHTIEAWVYHTGTTAKTICSNYWYQDGSSEYGWLFQILNTSSVLRFASAAASSIVASTTAVPTGTWAHVAATIVNLNVTFYINGVNAGGGGTVSSINYTNTIPSVGAAYSNGGFNSGPFVGYINDLRITQGYARYTSNFTPPTGPHRLK